MNIWKKVILAVVIASVATTVAAQSEVTADPSTALEARAKQMEVSMREAERQLEAAAQRIAELSSAEIARVGSHNQRRIVEGGRPVLGITISADNDRDPVEGVKVLGVSPGGAAAEAGLRSGDVITAINAESFRSANGEEANAKLLAFMDEVEEGEVLEVEYLRDNKSGSVELTPQQMQGRVFDFNFDGRGFDFPVMPNTPDIEAFVWAGRFGSHGFGDMEMVELNKSLGRYFGTDSGLLIIKAPTDNAYQLQDGDVIKNIDGRTPNDLRHALRILSSYQSGEKVSFEIMRDKRKKTVTVEIPEDAHGDRRSRLIAPDAFVAPTTSIFVSPGRKVKLKKEDRI